MFEIAYTQRFIFLAIFISLLIPSFTGWDRVLAGNFSLPSVQRLDFLLSSPSATPRYYSLGHKRRNRTDRGSGREYAKKLRQMTDS